jgi:putative SOS response-associated peptidase YedK
MCGRYAVTTDPATLAAELDALNEVPARYERSGGDPQAKRVAANYNVAPTNQVLTLVSRHDEEGDTPRRRIRSMRWGLVPHWSKDPSKGPVLFNARSESVAEKASFRTAMKSKRCLVPMDGWYEWKVGESQAAGKRAAKQPFFMTPADGSRLCMAGLWSVWHPPGERAEDAEPLLSCAILTTDSVGPLAEVHDRMPLIMTPDKWDRWLDPDHRADDELLAPPSVAVAQSIEIRPVRPLVNSVRNNGAELVERLDEQWSETLF